MRFRHPDGTAVHLAYCTNVHPAETLEGITAQLAAYAEPVRRAAGESVIGLGLWLPVDAAAALAADPAAVTRLRRELTARGLETVTLNGFPYKGFHAPVVKRAVYYPDWSEPARLDYTLNLARVLAGLLPDDAERGSVSTLPLAWRTAWSRTQRAAATRQLDKLAAGLRRIEAETGRTVRVAVEPEPGCVAETTAQAVEALKGVDHEWIGLCLDACHLAVAHEEPAAALAELLTAGLQVVKVQASSALQAADPADPRVREALAAFAEPRFLHQTREAAQGGGALLGSDDLGPALAGALPGRAPWRIHYHVPLHEEPAPPLASTGPVLRDTLRALFGGDHAVTDHIEVETYTWSVLPEGSRPVGDAGLARGIAAELGWTARELTALGLTRTAPAPAAPVSVPPAPAPPAPVPSAAQKEPGS
ncbi:metabolite traffic protein EboE [Streptomyces lavendulae]|uniref:metabolite traffic protein EboE n=1 Tax=Streptomyces lavendulae TaxID=1914 RepID=UPI0024A4177C|nr:metabolite traffic protein EboE [Streptomyces lavendulae]GLV98111.1 xylose isomerase [Streptomyces lavendulae subsp. lavendulae]